MGREVFQDVYDKVLNWPGNVVKQTNGVHGRPQLLHYTDVKYLKCLIQHRPNRFLDELQVIPLSGMVILRGSGGKLSSDSDSIELLELLSEPSSSSSSSSSLLPPPKVC